eukprot:PhM_4_TR10382/c1_g1_i1/m.31135
MRILKIKKKCVLIANFENNNNISLLHFCVRHNVLFLSVLLLLRLLAEKGIEFALLFLRSLFLGLDGHLGLLGHVALLLLALGDGRLARLLLGVALGLAALLLLAQRLEHVLLVVLELTVEGRDGLVSHQPQRHLGIHNKASVVGDDDHTALEVVDGVDERVDGLHIQVVRGLVEHQEMGFLSADECHRHTRLLTAGERLDLLVVRDALEAERAKALAGLVLVDEPTPLHHELDAGELERHLVDKVLVVAADAGVACKRGHALRGLERAVHQVEQRRLADTVRADETDAGVTPHSDAHVLVERRAAGVVERDVVELDEALGVAERRRVLEGERDCVLLPLLEHNVVEVAALLASAVLEDLVDLLLAHVLVALVGADFLALLLELVVVLAALGTERREEVVVAAGVVLQETVVDVHHVGADRVEELHVVANHHKGLGLAHVRVVHLGEVVLQPRDGVKVQVVRGLIEHQEVGLHEHSARQGNAFPPATREGAGVALVPFRGETEAVKDAAGEGLRGVGAGSGELFLHLHETVVLLVGGSVQRHKLLLFLEQVRAARVALNYDLHGGGVQLRYLLLLLDELNAQLLTDRNAALLQETQQRRLATTVRTHQTVAVPRGEVDLCVLEQFLALDRAREVLAEDVAVVGTHGHRLERSVVELASGGCLPVLGDLHDGVKASRGSGFLRHGVGLLLLGLFTAIRLTICATISTLTHCVCLCLNYSIKYRNCN